MNTSNLFSKYKQLEEEYTTLLNKYIEIEKMLKRYNLDPSDLLSDSTIHQIINKYKSKDVFWLMDLTGKSTYVSSSIVNFTGYNEKEYLAQSIHDRFTPESAQKAKNALLVHGAEFKNRGTKNPDTTFTIELEYICKNGSTKWGELSITPVFDENGDFCAIHGVTKDISETIKTKIKLFEQEKQFTNLLEHLPNYIFIHDYEKIVYANKISREELNINSTNTNINIDIDSKVVEKFKPMVREMIQKQSSNEPLEDYQIEVYNRHNEIKQVIIRRTQVVYNGIKSVLFILSDITDRVNFEKTILESEEKFRTLANVSPYGIMIMKDDLWVYTNPFSTILTEYTHEELSTKHFLEIIHPDFYEFAKENFQNRLNNKEFINEYELKIITKSGIEKWILVIGQTINYYQSKAVLFSISDITKLKETSIELEYAKNQAEASDRLKTAFLNNISHEIRTPLNGIVNFSEMILDGTLTNMEKYQYKKLLNESIDRLINTINDYMDISLIVSKNITKNTTQFSIEALTHHLYAKFKPEILRKNIHFEVNIDKSLQNKTVLTDDEIVKKIIYHIVSNSVKFTPENGSNILNINTEDNILIIEMLDNGEGISDNAIHSIYTPFSQEDFSATRKFEGSGLGLSITKGLVDVLNGEMNIESSKGTGTCVTIKIPIQIMTKEIKPTIQTVDKSKSIYPILIVEDEITNRMFLKLLLEKNGYKIVEATNGKMAVDLVQSGAQFALILMDIKMPIMNGLDATKIIKEISPNSIIIATTAYAMSGDEHKAIDAGCNDYITKPISKDILLEKISKYLR